MEIINTGNKSNFNYTRDLSRDRKVLNGFNKLSETILSEYIEDNDYRVQNVLFEKPITADLYITYPLSVVVKETITFDSLYSLIKAIRSAYRKIYREEENSMTKIKPNKALFNRGNSNGKYGIWGHSIYDLVIESIRILEGDKNPIVEVSIGS